jgi:hypothetical protein
MEEPPDCGSSDSRFPIVRELAEASPDRAERKQAGRWAPGVPVVAIRRGSFLTGALAATYSYDE